MPLQTFIEPNETYHAQPILTAGKLADFARSPRLYHQRHVLGNWKRPESDAMAFGSLVHLLTLEPDKAAALIRTDAPINPKTGRPYGADTDKAREWRDAVKGAGQLPVDQADVDVAATMAKHVHEACRFCEIPLSPDGPIDGAVAELSVRGTAGLHWAGEPVQCRPDLRLTDGEASTMWDLKTTENVDDFRWAVKAFFYDLSAAWYRALLLDMTGISHDWRWIVVEKKPPYRVVIVKAWDTICRAGVRLHKLMDRLLYLRDMQEWPLTNDGYERNLDAEPAP